MNIFLVLNVLGISPKESKLQMMYFDMNQDGPYKDFVGKVFAPWDGLVHRPSKYNNKQVLLVGQLKVPFTKTIYFYRIVYEGAIS